MERIEITVDNMGVVTIHATGYVGLACEKATREIERAIGKVTSKKATAERFAEKVAMKREAF